METCQKHQKGIETLLLCMEPNCWEVICSDCLYKHIKSKHPNFQNNQVNQINNPNNKENNIPGSSSASKKEIKIKALKRVQGEIVNFLIGIKCLYQKELKRMEGFRMKFNRDYDDNLERIRSSKESILDLVIHMFQRIEESYRTKVNLDEVNTRCENLIDKMKSNLADIELFQNCFSDTYNYEKDLPTLENLLKKYGHNEMSQEQYTIVTDVHELSSKLRESLVNIEVDDSRLYSTGMELSKYIKVVESDLHQFKTSNMLIESVDFFQPQVTKIAHFFEDGTRNFHRIILEKPLQKLQSPIHEVICLENENFLIPNYHRSVVTPQGDIYLTGGIDDRNGRDTPQSYKLDLNKKTLRPIDSMLKARNSHGMAFLDGYIYIIGGNSNEEGCVASCERYGTEQNKGWEKIANLNIAAYGPSVCSFRGKVLYKFGGKKNNWELSNTIEVYSPEKNKWTIVPFECETQFDKRNFILPCYSAASQINNNEILVLGGSDANGNNLTQTFMLKIDKEGNNQKSFVIREVNKRPLPEAECFDMGQIIILNHKIYCLQNSPIQALGYSTIGGPMTKVKKLLTFDDSQWTYIKH